MITTLEPPDSPEHTMAEYLLKNAKSETIADTLRLCKEYAPMAGDVLWTLVANGGDLNVEFARFACKPRTLLLEFSKNVREGKAAIPGFRLFWHYKESPLHGRSRECMGAASGESAEQVGSHRQHVASEHAGPNLRDLIAGSGQSIQQVAEKSGTSWMSLETFVRGEGKLLSRRAYDIAKVLGVMSEDVRVAFNKSCSQALGKPLAQDPAVILATPDQTCSGGPVMPKFPVTPPVNIGRRHNEVKKFIKMQDGGNIEIVIRYGKP